MLMLKYISISIIILLIIFNLFLRIKFPFWSIQPVFHIYDLSHWIFSNKIIDSELPRSNKYVKPLDIETYPVKNVPTDVAIKSAAFIKEHYLRNKYAEYNPEYDDIFNYLETSTPSFLSVYSKPKLLHDKSASIIDRDILGVITCRPLFITFKNRKNVLSVNYVDNLCVHKANRKQGIAPCLIQTHHYHIRHLNKSTKVCLFKREGEMTAIIPLTTYNTLTYEIDDFPKLKLEYASMKVLRITNNNISLFKDFIKGYATKFDCVINTEIMTIIKLLKEENLIIYSLIENHNVYALYIFRNTPSFVDGKKGVECIATINNCPHNDTFYNGFCSTLRRIKRKHKKQLVWLENTSDSNTIIGFNARHNVIHKTSCPTAFFLYNYASYTYKNNSCLFIY
uniref:Glycylpeptide N-tetradecanoyltransferase n=1 Tax=viral metagenome TaxID=1070528 RepID=A0A6C0CR10_9ZZZZ